MRGASLHEIRARGAEAFAFLKTLTVESVREFGDDNCTQLAAAISYYVLFAIFPLAIFVTGAMGLLLQDTQLEEDIIEAIIDLMQVSEDGDRQNDIADAVRDISGSASGLLGIVGLIGAAWAGSNMFGVIRRSINIAYDLEYHRPVVQQKLLDLALVVSMGPFFLLSIASTALLRTSREFSENLGPLGDLAEQMGFLWDAGSLIIPFTLSFSAFFVLYWIVPNTRVKRRDVWLGALIAALLFELTKFGFSIYLETLGQSNAVFGALGGVAIFLFWVFISSNILLFGAEVAAEYPRVRRGDYDSGENEGPSEPLLDRVRRSVRRLFIDDREKQD
ncbi:MAG: YihY/virulence factor BrkB family protein [Chloroflexi bacterium]|nr:YihY/virulence factor BrkB family protein [Chloroflexota bacterium]